jgi:hypothetical protein
MSCQACDDAGEGGEMAFVRVGAANVGLVGCREHVKQLLDDYNSASKWAFKAGMYAGRLASALRVIEKVRPFAKPWEAMLPFITYQDSEKLRSALLDFDNAELKLQQEREF